MVKLATNGCEWQSTRKASVSVLPFTTNHVTVLLSHVAFLSPPTQVNNHDKVTELSAATAILLVKLRWWFFSFENFG
jgi:hypothetical protein